MKTENTIYIVLLIIMILASCFKEVPAKYTNDLTSFPQTWKVVDTIAITPTDTVYEIKLIKL